VKTSCTDFGKNSALSGEKRRRRPKSAHFRDFAILQLRTNKSNKYIDLFIGTGRDFLKVRKPSELVGIKKIFRLVRADFPKSKICQKFCPKFWRGPKNSVKSQKNHFWIDLDKYCLSHKKNQYNLYPSPPKKFLLCHPNLEADLQKNAVISQAFENGHPKGVKRRVLEELRFNVAKLRAKCSPVCPIKNTKCCMAHLLSQ
jgi:hypothetical protein